MFTEEKGINDKELYGLFEKSKNLIDEARNHIGQTANTATEITSI